MTHEEQVKAVDEAQRRMTDAANELLKDPEIQKKLREYDIPKKDKE